MSQSRSLKLLYCHGIKQTFVLNCDLVHLFRFWVIGTKVQKYSALIQKESYYNIKLSRRGCLGIVSTVRFK